MLVALACSVRSASGVSIKLADWSVFNPQLGSVPHLDHWESMLDLFCFGISLSSAAKRASVVGVHLLMRLAVD